MEMVKLLTSNRNYVNNYSKIVSISSADRICLHLGKHYEFAGLKLEDAVVTRRNASNNLDDG